MISIEDSIPAKNESYKSGEDIFYVQFNDVFFYIEDEDQENLFFCILKNLFPKIRIEKIFPLGGKDNVIKESRNNIGNNQKVYIVDKDFDDILGRIEESPNLFYLERYSIENYLLENNAIVEYIIGEKPRLKRTDVSDQFDFDNCISTIGTTISSLVHLHLVVQCNCPQMKNVSLNHEKFVQFSSRSFSLKNAQIEQYKADIQTSLKQFDGRLTVNGQQKKMYLLIKFNTTELCITHIPGKYLIKMLKKFIETLFGLASRNIDSFCYRVAENCEFKSLQYLQINIKQYIT